MEMIKTPHINADADAFANTVLMPGDPKRSAFIAKNFLTDAVLVNDVRGVQGYTGYYNGKKVSVMASGMGMPAIGIYSFELFNYFNVENIIRIGSAGGIGDSVSLRDIVVGMTACYDSAFMDQFEMPGTYAPCASYKLLKTTADEALKLGLKLNIGNIVSTDAFYDSRDVMNKWKSMGVLAVEMESAALYANAAKSGKNALCICTISDLPLTGESLDASEREKSFTDMMKLALEVS